MQNRIGKFYEAARRWIRYEIPDGSELGIVEFKYKILQLLFKVLRHNHFVKTKNSDRAITKANLTVINSGTRPVLMNVVPSRANGGTCIGCGLLSALVVHQL